MTTTQAATSPPAPNLAPSSAQCDGDPERFDRFVREHERLVYSFCLRLLNDRCAAEDACQETFAAAWRNSGAGEHGRSWLLHVAMNKCRDEIRRRKRHPAEDVAVLPEGAECLIAGGPSPEALALNVEVQTMLQRALQALPWDQRLSVVLSDVHGASYAEIAVLTGASLGTVKSRIHRARRALRRRLRSEPLLEPHP